MQTLPFPMAQQSQQSLPVPLQQGAPVWQSAADDTIRHNISCQIFNIFNKRKGAGHSQRLPDFIKRIEDALYRSAKSMDEYMDTATLEFRLQDVARRYVRQTHANPQPGPGSVQPNSTGPPQATQSMPNGAQGQSGMAPGALNQGPSQIHGFASGFSGDLGNQMISRNSPLINGNGPASPVSMATAEAVHQPNPAFLNQMVPSSALGGSSNITGSTLMPNGAPVMIKRDFPQQQGMHGGNSFQTVPTMGGAMNSGGQPGQGFVPMGGTGMMPSSGMVPVTNGVNHQLQPPQMSQFGASQLQPVPLSSGGNGYPPGQGPAQPSGGGAEDKNSAVTKQQRWLLFLRHCAKCRQSEQECSLKAQCKFGKQLWHHILHCASPTCDFPRCTNSKDLLKHHQKCQDQRCPICVPVKEYVKRTRAQQQTVNPGAVMPKQEQMRMQYAPGMVPISGGGGSSGGGGVMPNPGGGGGMVPNPGSIGGMVPNPGGGMINPGGGGGGMVPNPSGMVPNPGGMIPNPGGMVPGQVGMLPNPGGMIPNPGGMMDHPQYSMPMQHPPHMMPGGMQQPMQHQQAAGQKRPHNQAFAGAFSAGASATASFAGGLVPGMRGSDDPNPKKMCSDDVLNKNTGTSLLEAFDKYQIKLHLQGIHEASAAARLQVPPGIAPNDICRVCGLTKMAFEPPLIYCLICGLKIKRGQVFYSTPEGSALEVKAQLCHTCFSDQKGDSITLQDATNFKKGALEKKKNEEDLEESWVQCDHCEGWVHQICGMFNKGRNNPDVHFMCPDCLLLGLEQGRRQQMTVRPQSMLDARELPKTHLSSFLESYMGNVIEEERRLRAAKQGVEPHRVPGCDQMSVRVVNNIVKKCEVKSRFVDTFSTAEGYPTEFSYRQRVIVLFQNIEGVDVCLYVMYVQEYGADCPGPNKNCVYLSYLDSVKYFRPEGVLAHGCPNPKTSLRTFVYHQLLVGYLSYVKKLGFEQMFIWACPPMAGDDYIMYCHPSTQKTPRSDRLRAWYLDMLKDAKSKGIVVGLSTLWDTFFDGGRDHRLERCSATHIPYLEGDYWPGEAENLLGLITDGKSGKGKSGSSGSNAKGKRYGPGPATTDGQLMSRLGEILGGNMREDFIVVHLRECCTFCRTHVTSGYMYKFHSSVPLKPPVPRTFEGVKLEVGCPNIPTGNISSISICESCFLDEQQRFATRDRPTRLPQGITPERLEMVLVEPEQRISDVDPDMECDFFETRQSFLNLCQGHNHYQFDTIRRAKHSSMMVLYHLHNPDAPTVSTSCNVCSIEIEPGTGFRCTVCPDYDMCALCKDRNGHIHPLTQHIRKVDETRVRLTDKERRERHEQLQRTMQLLVHACGCTNQSCSSNSCRKVRQLFQHAMNCNLKVTGGCQMCKKMWCLLNLHAKSCTKPDCPVPRCRELKEMRRRQAARQEDQRRKAYQNMLRVQNQSTSGH